jgi:hypothetical protein
MIYIITVSLFELLYYLHLQVLDGVVQLVQLQVGVVSVPDVALLAFS